MKYVTCQTDPLYRMKRYRTDETADPADTIQTVTELFIHLRRKPRL